LGSAEAVKNADAVAADLGRQFVGHAGQAGLADQMPFLLAFRLQVDGCRVPDAATLRVNRLCLINDDIERQAAKRAGLDFHGYLLEI